MAYPRQLRRLGALAVLGAMAISGCATASPSGGPGGSATTTVTTNPPPAANINPNANGVITGPINKARNTANAQDQQQSSEQQAGGG
ncbi:MAG: hypothetical protein ACRD1G_11075 [Acidimicrobiales bacterium]